MSEQPRTTESNDPQYTTGTSPHELIEKSLTGSSYSEVHTMQTSGQTPQEFVTSDDD